MRKNEVKRANAATGPRRAVSPTKLSRKYWYAQARAMPGHGSGRAVMDREGGRGAAGAMVGRDGTQIKA